MGSVSSPTVKCTDEGKAHLSCQWNWISDILAAGLEQSSATVYTLWSDVCPICTHFETRQIIIRSLSPQQTVTSKILFIFLDIVPQFNYFPETSLACAGSTLNIKSVAFKGFKNHVQIFLIRLLDPGSLSSLSWQDHEMSGSISTCKYQLYILRLLGFPELYCYTFTQNQCGNISMLKPTL